MFQMLCICIHDCILTKKNKSVEEEGLSEALVDTVLYLVVAETRLHNLHLAPGGSSWGFWLWYSFEKDQFLNLRAPVSKQLHSWRWLSQEAYLCRREDYILYTCCHDVDGDEQDQKKEEDRGRKWKYEGGRKTEISFKEGGKVSEVWRGQWLEVWREQQLASSCIWIGEPCCGT